jgi:hypothetical protein
VSILSEDHTAEDYPIRRWPGDRLVECLPLAAYLVRV